MRLIYDAFEIDPEGCRLLRDGRPVALEPRALDVLCYLAARPGRLIAKEELLSAIWKVQQLSPGVLANTIGKLRKALRQSARDSAPIETVHGRGYRWQAAPRHGEPAEPAAHVLPERTFVGRHGPLKLLLDHLARAVSQRAKLVLIRGEAGIGKTSLLAEFGRQAAARGVNAWQGAAYEGAGAPPYWPWVEVLRAARRELSLAEWERHLPKDASVLRCLEPEIFARLSASPEVDPRYARFQLFDQVTRLFASFAGSAPRLLLLEDLHWADAGTLELLTHAMRALAQHRILIVATLRERELSLDDDLAPALGRLERAARSVPLKGLSREELVELVNLHGPANWHPRALDVLFERTQGHPFFARKLIELLAEKGQAAEALVVKDLPIPSALREVVRQRLASLADPAREVLQAAAVIGMEFDACLLAEALAVPLAETLTALEPALTAGLVEPLTGIPHRLSFTHALVREALYEQLELRARGKLHRSLLQRLEARAQVGARALGELARHALSAVPSELDKSVAYCRRAAEAARDACGFEAAANLWSRASEKLASEAGDEHVRAELVLELGCDRYCAGDIGGALHALAGGAELARALGDSELLAKFAFRLIDCAEAGASDDPAHRAVQDALALGENLALETRATLLAHRAEIALELPFEERLALLAEADALAVRSGQPDALLEVACCRTNLRHPVRLDHTREAAQRLRSILRQPRYRDAGRGRVGMRHFSVEVSEYLCALTSAELPAADEIALRAHGLATEASILPLRVVVELMSAGRALGDGRLADVEGRLQALRESCERLTGGLGYSSLYYTLLLAEARGSLELLRGLPLPPLQTSTRYSARAWVMYAWLHAQLDNEALARSALASVSRAELFLMPNQHGDLGTLCLLAETYCLLGAAEEAARVYPQLAPHAQLNAVGPCFEYHGAVGHYVGMLCVVLGREQEAVRHFVEARRINERLAMPLHCARTEAALARLSTP